MEKQCDDEKTTTRSMRLNEVATDILVDILSKLPEKSLGRFTCVAKEWHSLISSPHPGFVKDLRRQRLRHKSYLYFWNSMPHHISGYWDGSGTCLVDTVNERIQDNFHPPMMDTDTCFVFSIISCHNLLCLVGDDISIINPSTQNKAILLPRSSGRDIDIHPVSSGLGYSSVAEEFKIVRWLSDLHGSNMMCEIFSLTDRDLVFKSDSWRLLNETTRPYEFLDTLSVSINGMIFWLIFKPPHPIHLYTNSILAFDLDEEQSKIISCPNLIPDVIPYLVELKECLYLAHCWEGKAIVKMWRLQDPKNNNNVWVLEYYINFPSICNTIVPLTSTVLADHLIFLSNSTQGGGLLYYNVGSGTMRKLDNLGKFNFVPVRYEIPCVLKNIEF